MVRVVPLDSPDVSTLSQQEISKRYDVIYSFLCEWAGEGKDFLRRDRLLEALEAIHQEHGKGPKHSFSGVSFKRDVVIIMWEANKRAGGIRNGIVLQNNVDFEYFAPNSDFPTASIDLIAYCLVNAANRDKVHVQTIKSLLRGQNVDADSVCYWGFANYDFGFLCHNLAKMQGHDIQNLEDFHSHGGWGFLVFRFVVVSFVITNVVIFMTAGAALSDACHPSNNETIDGLSCVYALRSCCRHEGWRYISSAFLHANTNHILMNDLALMMFGFTFELGQGAWSTFAILLVGIVAGNLSSTFFDPEIDMVVGASGSVFAFFGAWVAVWMQNWDTIDVLWKTIPLFCMMVYIVHEFATGFDKRLNSNDSGNVSLSSHCGGFVAGLTVGLFIVENTRIQLVERWFQWIGLSICSSGIAFATLWLVIATPDRDSSCFENTCVFDPPQYSFHKTWEAN